MNRTQGHSCGGGSNLIHQIQIVWLVVALLSAPVTFAWLVIQW
jgi:hypothetical protein